MLSKICSRVGRYSHTPELAGKHRQAQRLPHTQENESSRITQLTRECMSDLKKLEINPSLQKKINHLQALYYDDLQLLAEAEYQALPNHAIFEPDDSAAARERAEAVQLYRGVGAVARFLDEYSVHTPGMTLGDAISVRHKNYLLNSLHASYQKLSPSDQLALASVIRPDVLRTLGIPCPAEGRQLSLANYQAAKAQLNEHHVLALVDYCSSSTGHFNAINDSIRVWQLCGIKTLAMVTSCVSAPLEEALTILSTHEAFVYKGTTWKGIALMDPAGPFRLSQIQPGMSYTSPHWSSVTSVENQNYSQKGDFFRTCKLTIHDAEGVRVHMFNDEKTIDESEVMLPPKPMHFIEGSGKRINVAGAAMHVYCTMKADSSEADTRCNAPQGIRV